VGLATLVQQPLEKVRIAISLIRKAVDTAWLPDGTLRYLVTGWCCQTLGLKHGEGPLDPPVPDPFLGVIDDDALRGVEDRPDVLHGAILHTKRCATYIWYRYIDFAIGCIARMYRSECGSHNNTYDEMHSEQSFYSCRDR